MCHIKEKIDKETKNAPGGAFFRQNKLGSRFAKAKVI